MIALLAACEPEMSIAPVPAPQTEVALGAAAASDDASSCRSTAVDRDGGALDGDGASLVVPPGAFVDQGVVTLCPVPSPDPSSHDAWRVSVDPEMSVYEPLQLAIRTADPNPAEALFVPGPDGTAVRSLLASPEGDGTWTGQLWRTGTAWIGTDERTVRPFEPTPLGVDLLLVVDDSCSMLDEQAKLAEVLPPFLDRLDPFEVDYHVGVITTGSSLRTTYRGQSWVGPDTKRRDDVLAELVAVGNDSSLDQGLASLWSALGANSYAPQHGGDGFYRDSAELQILAVSGDDDLSTVTPEQVADVLWSLGRPGIGASGLVPMQGTDAGTKYVELAKLVGGFTGDLDGDWDAVLDPIGDQLVLASGMVLPAHAELWVVPLDAEPALCVERITDGDGRTTCLDPLAEGTELWVVE